MAATNGPEMVRTVDPETFLDKIIEFPKNSKYERIRPITDYRRDPGEARILYTCRRVQSADDIDSSDHEKIEKDQEFILKVKVQVPPRPASDDPTEPLAGPSETTAAELKALQVFTDCGVEGVPHLIASTCKPQGTDGPWPGGYVACTVMTKMPGCDLMELRYWSLSDEVKEGIRAKFLETLKSIWRLGIAPYDCALRNILWEAESRKLSIVDFEHWTKAKDVVNMHETQEMQAWGIVQRPPPSHWAIEWGLTREYNRPL